MLSKLLTAKVASAATIAAFGLGTAAAAATGSLPGQTSHANSHAVTAGLTTASSAVDHSSNTNSGTHGKSANHSPTGNGLNSATGVANTHAQFGLCTAFVAGNSSTSTTALPPQDNSTAFKALMDGRSVSDTLSWCNNTVIAQHNATKGSDTTDATDTPDNSTDTGQPSGTPSHSTDKPSSTPSTPPTSTPPVSVPDQGTSGSAPSDGNSTSGATHASSAH